MILNQYRWSLTDYDDCQPRPGLYCAIWYDHILVQIGVTHFGLSHFYKTQTFVEQSGMKSEHKLLKDHFYSRYESRLHQVAFLIINNFLYCSYSHYLIQAIAHISS